MYVKGHVENAFNVTNIDKLAINKLPRSFLKKSGGIISENFTSSLGLSFIVNATKF